ncbi:MAG TPA: hypothetical protein VFX37_12275 [Pseudolabrys sp.]|nr:hypothetical protein [Pseudolabrys sp.]
MLAALLGALGGCTAAAIEDKLPSSVGLPADAPARPATPYEYPAVHDMPPPRSDTPLTEDEQIRLQKELTTLRNKQEGLNAEALKSKPAAKRKKKPLPDASKGQTRGGGDNP